MVKSVIFSKEPSMTLQCRRLGPGRQGEGQGQDLGGQGQELEQGLAVEMGKGEIEAEGTGQNEATSWKQGTVVT